MGYEHGMTWISGAPGDIVEPGMGADPEASTCEARKASEVVKVPGWEAKGFPLSFAIKVGLWKISEVQTELQTQN